MEPRRERGKFKGIEGGRERKRVTTLVTEIHKIIQSERELWGEKKIEGVQVSVQ